MTNQSPKVHCPQCGKLVEYQPEYMFYGDTGKPVLAEKTGRNRWTQHTDYRCVKFLRMQRKKLLRILEKITDEVFPVHLDVGENKGESIRSQIDHRLLNKAHKIISEIKKSDEK